jgi:hypothetical protein
MQQFKWLGTSEFRIVHTMMAGYSESSPELISSLQLHSKIKHKSNANKIGNTWPLESIEVSKPIKKMLTIEVVASELPFLHLLCGTCISVDCKG